MFQIFYPGVTGPGLRDTPVIGGRLISSAETLYALLRLMSHQTNRFSENTERKDKLSQPKPPISDSSSTKATRRSGHSENGRIIILSGPPGAGKSTVAKALVNSSAAPTAYIEGDTFWHFIVKRGTDAPKPRATTGRIVMKSMMLAAIPYARGGYETIVDFSIGPWFLGLFKPWMKDIHVDYFILCPSEEVCAQRAASREEGAKHDHELFVAFSELGEFEKYAIRNDDADAEELARIIHEGVTSGGYKLDFSKIVD
jgi:hypothetical protein